MATYTWTPCANFLPPKDLTVEICNAAWTDETSWLGWHDGDHWYMAEGMWLDAAADSGEADAEPTHWKLRTPLPSDDGMTIVIVLRDTPGSDTVNFVAEFEPELGKREDGVAAQLFVEILKTVAEAVRRGKREGQI